jgi:hypothetical protein
MRSFVFFLAVLLCSCGYRVGTHSDIVPKTVKTIAVPAFGNLTVRYRLAESIPAAITRELIARTRYKIVADPNQADAILSGAVVNYWSFPTIFDPATGRASSVQINITMQVALRERASGAVLFNRPNLDMRQRYEISTDPRAYFDESDIGLQRLSQDVARTVVAAILESF